MTATATFLNETDQPRTCGACGSVLQGRWESLSAGLCRTLVKIYEATKRKGINEVHLQRDVELTKNEFANAQKLKYFGLVAKIDEKPGYWLLTFNGREFVANRKAIAKKVFVFHNVTQCSNGELVNIADAIGQQPYWLRREDYLPPLQEMQQAALF